MVRTLSGRRNQKVLFLCNCCSTTLVPSLSDQSCCSGTSGRTKKAEWRQNHCHGGSSVAVVAEWRHSGRHSDRSMDAIGRPKEAQWWYKEGWRVAQIDRQCSHFFLGDQWQTTVHPFCDHGHVCAFILPPLSDLWATDLLGDLCLNVLYIYVPPLNDQGNRSASLLPSTVTWPVLWSHKGGTKVAAPV